MAFDARLGVREIYSMLGPSANHAILASHARPTTQAAWECGCVIEYASHRELLHWEQCDRHGLPESAILAESVSARSA